MKLSIEINGVYLPFGQIIESWRRHCFPLLHYINSDQGFDLGYAGSSFLFKHKGQLLQIFSNHQLKNLGIAPEDVLIFRDELPKEKALGPGQIITPSVTEQIHANLNDIKIVRYGSEQNTDALEARFFKNDLTTMQNLETVVPESIVLIFTVGFPHSNGRVNCPYDEELEAFEHVHIISASTKLYLQTTKGITLDPDNRIPLEIHDDFEVPKRYCFNGFSGAPVFFIYQDEHKTAHLGFAGMITEVLQGTRLQIYPGSIIQSILRDL